MVFKSVMLGRLSATWLVLAATAAGAEPLTLDRLLKVAELGGTALSPDGRHLVIETRAPYDQAPSFDAETLGARLGRLMVADLATPTPARPLIPVEKGAGYAAGPFSPSGRRMVVTRWKGHRADAGVVDLETGKVRWLGFGLEQANFGRSLQWLSDTRLVALARDPGDPTLKLKLGWQNQERLTALWAQQTAGQVATVKVIGSGRARRPEPMADRRLVDVDLARGTQAVLAAGGFFDLELSPSGRYVAVLEDAERIGLVETPALRMMAPSRRRALSIVDLRTGAVFKPCPSCTTLIEPMVWSPNADRLLVFQHPADRLETQGQLTLVDATTGAVRRVGADVSVDFDYGDEGAARVRADWLGDHPIVLAKTAATGRNDWYDLSGKAAANLTQALPAAPRSIALDSGSSMLALVGDRVWRVEASGAAVLLPVKGSGWMRPSDFGVGLRPRSAPWRTHHPILRTPTGLTDLDGHAEALPPDTTPVARLARQTVVAFSTPQGVRGVSLLGDQNQRRDLVSLNRDFADLDLGLVRAVESKASNGQVLKSWLYLPPSWSRGQKPALIVVPYPGSAPQSVTARFSLTSNTFTPNAAFLAGQGYAVLVPALPRDATLGEPSQGLADDILSVVDAVVAEGLADPDRLALWGHSFGGYAAMATATQTHRFKAIIAQAGLADLVANWSGVDPYYATAPEDGGPNPFALAYNETGQGALLGPPWRQSDRYLRNSPLFQADKITTPMMLIHGDQDFVGLGQAQAMFNALYRQDKDATLLTLFGERHLPSSPANIRAIYAEVLPWLADRLASPSRSAASDARRPSQ